MENIQPNMLTKEDLTQIEAIGYNLQQIENQLEQFKQGFPYMKLIRPAVVNDGIKLITTTGEIKLNKDFDEFASELKIIKFVPASGAATRMFKDLFSFKDNYSSSSADPNVMAFGKTFFQSITKFAFYSDLAESLAGDGFTLSDELIAKNYGLILDYLLTEKGLNYANLPKALLKFHLYSKEARTAIEEHLVEGALCGKSADGVVYVHFTISPEHVDLFEAHIQKVVSKYEKKHQVKYQITHSLQQPTTDTIAVNLDNSPFRTKEKKLLFRPAGHGALIWNINQLKADVIFVKNIDNVSPERKNEATIVYKKVIGSLLIQFKKTINKTINQLLSKSKVNFDEIVSFAKNDLFISIPSNFNELEDAEKRTLLISLINKPIRVCGMVKNEGEPGGGPFWTKNEDGTSLQIVESSQIDFGVDAQKRMVELSTHFNPVDLVCNITDYKGDVFDLSQFVDDKTGFISVKSKDGKDLKALELPGLWNGAMAKWITVFVEVPIATFNPVKTINDLLRSEHQN